MNLTEGKLFWKVPLFALPMALSTILQLLYSTVDLWTVSHFGGGSNSMSAVGSNTPLINLVITLFVSLAVGTNVAMGNAKGANDKDRAEKVLSTSMILSIICGIVVALIGYFCSFSLLKLMNTPSDIIDMAATYLKIYFIGVPFLIIYNFGAQALRALGDSRRPFYFLAISGVINVIFDLIFVIYGHMDVAGVAWATVLSEFISAVLTVMWLLLYKKGFVRLELKKLRMDSESLKEILKIGLPAGLQGLGFCIPNVIIQSALYTIPDYTYNGILISQNEIVAGSSGASQVENYVYAFIEAYALACVTFVGQNYGAKKKENIKKSFFYCLCWMAITWALCSIFVLALPNQILSVFVTDGEDFNKDAALMAGQQRMFMMVFTYILDGIMDITSQYLRGMKRSTIPATVTLIGCTGSRILFVYTLFQTATFHSIFWLYFCYPMSWTLVDLIYIPLVLVIQKKAFKEIDGIALSNEEVKAHV